MLIGQNLNIYQILLERKKSYKTKVNKSQDQHFGFNYLLQNLKTQNYSHIFESCKNFRHNIFNDIKIEVTKPG